MIIIFYFLVISIFLIIFAPTKAYRPREHNIFPFL